MMLLKDIAKQTMSNAPDYDAAFQVFENEFRAISQQMIEEGIKKGHIQPDDREECMDIINDKIDHFWNGSNEELTDGMNNAKLCSIGCDILEGFLRGRLGDQIYTAGIASLTDTLNNFREVQTIREGIPTGRVIAFPKNR